MGSIFDTLKKIGVTSEETRTLFTRRTRDIEDLKVWQDSRSRVIYIDDFYVGDEEYESGDYQNSEAEEITDCGDENVVDTSRRLADYRQYYTGKNICDLGCGDGTFLKGAHDLASRVSGVEIQKSFLARLKKNGIPCEESILCYQNDFDTVFMFHSLEHFENPLKTLGNVRCRMAKDHARLVVEVPHANDFLLSNLKSKEFMNFTLWSQHLILHTRESLRRLLEAAGFSRILIEGKQRYGISNHLTWLADKQPGGHNSTLSSFETDQLKLAYESALQKIDATDTIIAIAEY